MDILFALLRGAAVDVGVQPADDKAILQVEQAGGEVVVLTDGVDSPVSLLKGNLFGLFYQQRTNMGRASRG